MIVSLLIVSLAIAVVVSSIVMLAFDRPIASILRRVVPADLSYAWVRYLRYALFVVGIAGGVQVWSFEKYLAAPDPANKVGVVELTSDRWVLEVFNAVIGTLQSTAMVLLLFFVFALIGVVIVRLFEARSARGDQAHDSPGR